jgi:hypothetical protein
MLTRVQMKRAFHILAVLAFIISIAVSLPNCLFAYCPLQKIVKPEAKQKAARDAGRPPKPCCAKKGNAGKETADSSSCPFRLAKSQPPMEPGIVKSAPELQPETSDLLSAETEADGYSEIFPLKKMPVRARSTPIILEKQSFLI